MTLKKFILQIMPVVLSGGLWLFSACHTGYRITQIDGSRVEMTAAFDQSPDREAEALLAPFKAKVDSIMKPVIGKSAVAMKPDRPESLLSNLIADVLRESSSRYTGKPAEIAVINIGGLRNDLPQGNITYGDVYEILPFENSLCVLIMDGHSVKQLFDEIAQSRGEGISGAKLVLSEDGKVTGAWVGGEKLDEDKLYTVATVDYLSEGNDGMTAFLLAKEKTCPDGATIRQIFLDYISSQTRQGKALTSALDGRIRIQN